MIENIAAQLTSVEHAGQVHNTVLCPATAYQTLAATSPPIANLLLSIRASEPLERARMQQCPVHSESLSDDITSHLTFLLLLPALSSRDCATVLLVSLLSGSHTQPCTVSALLGCVSCVLPPLLLRLVSRSARSALRRRHYH